MKSGRQNRSAENAGTEITRKAFKAISPESADLKTTEVATKSIKDKPAIIGTHFFVMLSRGLNP